MEILIKTEKLGVGGGRCLIYNGLQLYRKCNLFIVNQEGWGGHIYHPKIQAYVWDALSQKLYMYMCTYIYIYKSQYENPVVKKYRPFYNNSTIDFYYNTQ